MGTARRIRHWKEQFSLNASYVWSKSTLCNGKLTVVGAIIPKKLSDNKIKLRRLWDSRFIQLAPHTANYTILK